MPISISDIVGRSEQLANQRQGLATQTASSVANEGLKAAANDIASLSAMSAARARTAQINKSAAEVANLRDEMAMRRKKAPLDLARLQQLLDQSAENHGLEIAAKKIALFEHGQTQQARIAAANLAPEVQQEQLTATKIANKEAAAKEPLNALMTEIQTQMANNQLEHMPESLALANLMIQGKKGNLEQQIESRGWDKAVKGLTGVVEAVSSGNMDRANLMYKDIKPTLDTLTKGSAKLPDTLDENNIGVISNLLKMATASVKHLQDMDKTAGTTAFNRLVSIANQKRANNKQNRTIQNDIQSDVRFDTVDLIGSKVDTKGNYITRPKLADFTDSIQSFLFKHFGKDYREPWHKIVPLLTTEDAKGINTGNILALDTPKYMERLWQAYNIATEKGTAKDTNTGFRDFSKEFLLANIAALTGKL